MRCDICGKDEGSLFKVNHKDRGRIKVCESCQENECYKLLNTGVCCCQ